MIDPRLKVPFSIGFVAPSSIIPKSEFEMGLRKVAEAGFDITVHPQCYRKDLFFAGTDQERADALYEYATHPGFPVVWCARGGYGSNHLLRLLEQHTLSRGIPPRKLLIGSSDATALLEYARSRWGWSVLHAAMPGIRNFQLLAPKEWNATCHFIKWGMSPGITRGKKAQRKQQGLEPWGKLKFFGKSPGQPIRAEVVGGNLTVWNSLTGTRFAPKPEGKILFFEDISESLSRIDRMIHQLADSGGFDSVKAVVLGNFLSCDDPVPQVLADIPSARQFRRVVKNPKPSELVPLRKSCNQLQGLKRIFGVVTERFRIPVAYGLPAGHGPGRAPVPLGAQYVLSPDGKFRLEAWDWPGECGRGA